MNHSGKKRVYWMEGVTRNEIEHSLYDTRPSVLRRQRPRRILVATAALLIVALAFSMFITHPKVKSYVEVVLSAACMVLYFQLRRSVRRVSDAPDELLDERQVAIRDAGYTVAYRILSIATTFFAVLALAVQPGGLLQEYAGENILTSLAWSYIWCSASLPSMVLAWRTPSEPMDAPA